jgi:hypothetical protein
VTLKLEMFKNLPFLQKGDSEEVIPAYWFPGRWVGGITLVIGPLLLLAGVLLRIRFPFFFPHQLAAYQEQPILVFSAYSCFLAGNILLSFAILTLVQLIGRQQPGWAAWGGVMVISGLFARTFHAGIDHFAFQLVRIHDLDLAQKTVAGSYGAFHIVSMLSSFILFGWIVLAIGAYLSNTLGLLRSLALASMAALMIGVLKGSTMVSVGATAGLCLALVPLGIQVLRQGPTPGYKPVIAWSFLVAGILVLLYFLGQAG